MDCAICLRFGARARLAIDAPAFRRSTAAFFGPRTALSGTARFRVGSRDLTNARTFSAAPRGAPFWYGNSLGLVEFAGYQASAAALLGLKVGDAVVAAP